MIAAWNINRLSLGSTPPFLTRFLNWSTLCQWYKLIQVSNVSWFPLFLSCGISLVEPMATWLQKFWKKVKHMTPVLTGFLSAACCSNCLWGRYINKFSLNSSIPWRKKRNPEYLLFWFDLRDFSGRYWWYRLSAVRYIPYMCHKVGDRQLCRLYDTALGNVAGKEWNSKGNFREYLM